MGVVFDGIRPADYPPTLLTLDTADRMDNTVCSDTQSRRSKRQHRSPKSIAIFVKRNYAIKFQNCQGLLWFMSTIVN